MPESAADITHAKGAPYIVNDPPWARLPIGHSGLTRHLSIMKLIVVFLKIRALSLMPSI
jgi:hypothetical protein